MVQPRYLSTRRGLSVAAVVAALGIAAPYPQRAHGEASAVDGVLVLRNGNVLAGSVRRFGDDYSIDVTGAAFQVPAEQVEMFARSLEDAYDERRRERTGLSADSHLELARWCMKVDLLSQAARELLDARTLDPQHSGLAAMETRLRQMLELEATRAARAEGAATAAHDAAADQPVDELTLPAVDISDDARTQFVRSIQPMLIRSCAMGGCHQPGSAQRLQLDRWAAEGNGSPELVRRNLTSALGALNVDDPASSALVQWGRTSHGRRPAGPSRPLSAHQAALLLEWLNEAAGVTPSVATVSADPDVEPPALAGEGEALNDGTQSGEFAPRDEFDPEIFNREYAGTDEKRDAKPVAAADQPPTASASE